MTVSTQVASKEKLLPAVKTALIALAGSALLALSARFALHLPFAPVPITMQTFAVLMLGATLGPKRAAWSCVAYLIEGTMGLPVFAHGMACATWFLTPRVGYVLGFVLAAFLVGKFSNSKNLFKLIYAFALGEAVILAAGWLGMIPLVGTVKEAFVLAVVPYLIGAVYKILSAAFLVRGFQKARGS